MRRASLLLIGILLSYAACAIALPEDSKAKLNIKSDEATYNYKTGNKIFEGHVIVDQGTTHITADKLTTRNNFQHKIEEAIAYGVNEPAHYWTINKAGQPVMHAYGKVIKFYPITSNVVLEKDVTIKQGENSFKGELVFYNMHDQTITVPPTQHGRAVLVYNPDK